MRHAPAAMRTVHAVVRAPVVGTTKFGTVVGTTKSSVNVILVLIIGGLWIGPGDLQESIREPRAQVDYW